MMTGPLVVPRTRIGGKRGRLLECLGDVSEGVSVHRPGDRIWVVKNPAEFKVDD